MFYLFRVALDVVLLSSPLRALPVVGKPFIGENFGGYFDIKDAGGELAFRF